MNDFLDVAERLHWSGQAADSKEHFELVFEGLSRLQETQSKFGLPFRNIEEAFAAFEMAGIVGRLGGMDRGSIGRLPSAMRRLIWRTLELTIPFTADSQAIHPPLEYAHLVQLIKAIDRGRPWDRSSVVTFNYDLALDYAVQCDGTRVDYCLGDSNLGHGARVMKLHGSLNWKFCQECGKLEEWQLQDYFSKLTRTGPFPDRVKLEVALRISGQTHGCGARLEPFIVPPTWNKTMHRTHLAKVWAAAAEELADAREIIVIGYSLPETDVFFRHLMALGTVGTTRVQKFWVFDPEEKVREKFERILGPAVTERFKFHEMKFGDAIRHLEKNLERTPAVP